MKITVTFAFCMLLFLTAFSCKKKATEVNSDFVGSWSATNSENNYSLTIESDSKGAYSSFNGVTTKSFKGYARVKGNTLKVFNQKFSIDRNPKQDSINLNVYTLILDGITFTAYK